MNNKKPSIYIIMSSYRIPLIITIHVDAEQTLKNNKYMADILLSMQFV